MAVPSPILFFVFLLGVSAWSPPSMSNMASQKNVLHKKHPLGVLKSRRVFVLSPIPFLLLPSESKALVTGNAPPAKRKGPAKVTCKTIDECEEIGRQREQKIEEEVGGAVLLDGVHQIGDVRFGDVKIGEGEMVGEGRLTVNLTVLKPGKRSFDGLSGAGTTIFTKENFTFDRSDVGVVKSLRLGVEGMKKGGVRRIGVEPQNGWEKPTRDCDGGPGGRGSGGDVKTDYTIVPTAKMVSLETCFDKLMKPFPDDFAQGRRMAQRFDQALVIEVEVVSGEEDSYIIAHVIKLS